jgi:hypothetical protein
MPHSLGTFETGYEDMDWIQMAQDRVEEQTLVNISMNLWI